MNRKIQTWYKHFISYFLWCCLGGLAWQVQAGPADGTLKWSYPVGGSFSQPATQQNGTVFMTSASGILYSIDAEGTLLWQHEVGGDSTAGGPVIGRGNRVYYGSTNGKVYAFTNSGLLQWEVDIGAAIRSTAAINSEGQIAVMATDGFVYLLNLDGSLAWKYSIGQSSNTTPSFDRDDNIYVGDVNGVLYSISKTGAFRWSYGTNNDFNHNGIAIDNEQNIYVTNLSGVLYAFTQNGELKWTFDSKYRADVSPIVLLDGRIAFGNYDKYFYVVNKDGTESWSYFTQGRIIRSSAAQLNDGTILLGSYSRNLIALSPEGVLKWTFRTTGYIFSTPTVAGDGTIYFNSNDGNLYALHGREPLAETGWPRIGSSQGSTGRSTHDDPKPLPVGAIVQWDYQTGGAVRGRPYVDAQKNVYSTSNEGSLFSFNHYGEKRWNYFAATTSMSSPLEHNDISYFGNNAGEFYAVNSEGWALWKANLIGGIRARATIHQDTIYVATMSGYVYSIGLDGTILWSYNAGSSIYNHVVIDNQNNIYFTSDANKLISLSIDGTFRWDVDLVDRGVAGIVFGFNQKLYTASLDGTFYSVNSNGEVLWQKKVTGQLTTQELAIGPDETLYAGSYDNHVYAIRSNGEVRWKYNMGDWVSASPIYVTPKNQSSFIAAVSKQGVVVHLSLSGVALWSLPLSEEAIGTPRFDKNTGYLYLGTMSGKLYAIRQY